MNTLEVKGISKHFGGVVALSEASMEIEQGTVCGLLGANGSGKTTLSRVISGLYCADSGEILFEGKPVAIHSTKQALKIGIAMAHQNLSLVNDMTVWENICMGNEQKRGILIDSRTLLAQAKQALERFGLQGLEMCKVSELSPSQKQLVEICKAVSLKPKLLILDEPTASLEFAQVNMLFDIVAELKEQGTSIVFISHRMWEVTQLCDKVVVLRNGKTVSTLDLREIDPEEHNKKILREITGKEEETQVHASGAKLGAAMLKVENLCIKNILHDINFEVKEGEIVGISGLQGMGQEELLLAISGFLPKTSGEIYFKNEKTKWNSAKKAIDAGVVLVPGDRNKEGLFLQHTVFDNLLYPEFCSRKSPFILKHRALKKKTDELMDKISLTPRDPSMNVGNLSGGNQQKVVVGKWINRKPNVLLMSDPAKGIDVEARRELYEICRGFAQEGKAVLLYASDNHELVDICNRVLVMFEGKVVAEVPREELSDARLVEEALHMHNEGGGENGKSTD